MTVIINSVPKFLKNFIWIAQLSADELATRVNNNFCQIKVIWESYNHLIVFILKPCQNKKGQSFFVMLGFFMSFLNLHQLSAAKERHAISKISITTNFWSYLFCQSFKVWYDSICQWNLIKSSFLNLIFVKKFYVFGSNFCWVQVSKSQKRFLNHQF